MEESSRGLQKGPVRNGRALLSAARSESGQEGEADGPEAGFPPAAQGQCEKSQIFSPKIKIGSTKILRPRTPSWLQVTRGQG